MKIDEIMTCAEVAQVDFQSFMEEAEKIKENWPGPFGDLAAELLFKARNGIDDVLLTIHISRLLGRLFFFEMFEHSLTSSILSSRNWAKADRNNGHKQFEFPIAGKSQTNDAERCTTQSERIPCDPVGFSSIAQKPTSVSSLSASATATDTGSPGTKSEGPCGL